MKAKTRKFGNMTGTDGTFEGLQRSMMKGRVKKPFPSFEDAQRAAGKDARRGNKR